MRLLEAGLMVAVLCCNSAHAAPTASPIIPPSASDDISLVCSGTYVDTDTMSGKPMEETRSYVLHKDGYDWKMRIVSGVNEDYLAQGDHYSDEKLPGKPHWGQLVQVSDLLITAETSAHQDADANKPLPGRTAGASDFVMPDDPGPIESFTSTRAISIDRTSGRIRDMTTDLRGSDEPTHEEFRTFEGECHRQGKQF